MDAASKIKRKQIIIAVGGFLAFIFLLVFGMWLSDPNKGKPSPLEVQAEKSKEVMKNFTASSSGGVSAEDTWISKSEKQIREFKLENQMLKERLDELSKKFEGRDDLAAQGTPVNPGLPSVTLPPAPNDSQARDSGLQGSVGGIVPPPVIPSGLPPPPIQSPVSSYNSNSQASNQNGQPFSRIEVISLSSEPAKGIEGKKPKKVSHYLPTGSFSTAVLLSGMDAPTGGQAKTNPVPVLLRLMDAGQLPNFWNSDVDKCHATGAAHGDISSERAHIRLETLTCVLVSGEIIEEPIKGYVAGEDGKAGLRGRLVTKEGALIAKTLLAGTASGMGNSIVQQYQQVSSSPLGVVTSVDPNKTVQTGLAQGSGTALNKLADYWIARANEIFPIIEVDANRIGEIILLGGTDFGTDLIGNTREAKVQ